MLETLKRVPLFVPLISIFFVLHGVLENFGFIPAGDAFVLALVYLGATLLVWAIGRVVFRGWQRAALPTAAVMAFFFFYEAFIQWMTRHFPHRFFTTNSFLLLFGLLLLIAVFFGVRKNKGDFSRLYLFLNVLLGVYVVIDTGGLIVKMLHPPVNPLSVAGSVNGERTPVCAGCAKPNVYFLLFDEYAGSRALAEQYHFDNSYLDSFLVKQGFHINDQSSSNYNLTPFSIASVLNMSYIEGIKDPRRILSLDYTNTYQLIRDSKVVDLFSREGYAIKNLSLFDLAGQPTRAWQSFLPLKTRLITARTLSERLQRHWNSLVVHYFGIRYFVVRDYMKYEAVNAEFLKATAAEADQAVAEAHQGAAEADEGAAGADQAADRRDSRPKFVYAHFMMPHYPYLFDSLGRRRSDREIYEERETNPDTAYLGYLQYTNRKVVDLVGHIRQRDPGAVILLCGDHGYRGAANRQNPLFQFRNLNAVYFPDHEYGLWAGRVSFVNQFRIVFNQLFHAGYPLLKDSTILLSE